MVSTLRFAINCATVPPPPASTLPSSVICHATSASFNIFLIFATNSAFASDVPDFPRAPVNLENATPSPIYAVFIGSETLLYVGSRPHVTSDDRHIDFSNIFLTASSQYFPFILYKRFDTKVSKNLDCIPVFPIEPISSLSARKHTDVLSGVSVSQIPLRAVYAHTLSS